MCILAIYPLRWRHNERNGISNHQPHDCLRNRLFRPRSKETSKLRVTGLCEGNSPVTNGFPHKGPVTRKMFPFDDVIMDVNSIKVPPGFSRPFLMTSSGKQNIYEITWRKHMANLIIITLPTDTLEPLIARTSVGSVVTVHISNLGWGLLKLHSFISS